MNETEVIILCDRDQEIKKRNYEIGKIWASVLYCLASEECPEKGCPYKKVVE